MNEEERAEWLARAIDDLLKGDRQSEPVSEPLAGLEAEELKALMRVARARLDKARDSSHAGVQYEGAIWQQVLSRLDSHFEGDRSGLASELDWLADAGKSAGMQNPEVEDPSWRHAEIEELREIALLRRRIAEEAASFAEEHREAVWRRLQSRIQQHPQKAGVFSFLRRLWPNAARSRVASDRNSVQASDDETLDGLIRIARARRETSGTAGFASRPRLEQLWARIVPGLSDQLLGQQGHSNLSRRRSQRWPLKASYIAASGAVAALVIAAIGPIPATGLANHPAADFVRFLGHHAGVTETSAPPAAPEDGTLSQGVDASASEAASLLAIPVREPATMPQGFTRTSSQYFPQALTAAEHGMFVVIYDGVGASIVIYQEHASGATISAQEDSAFDVTLADGTPATYVDGAWTASSTGFEWTDGASQTLLFDRGGVRMTIRYSGSRVDRAILFSIANGMAAGR